MGEEYESKWFDDTQKMVGKDYLDPEASHLTIGPDLPAQPRHSQGGQGRPRPHPHGDQGGLPGSAQGRGRLGELPRHDDRAGGRVGRHRTSIPRTTNPELTTSEPYVMGSHATCSGAWASGPEDLRPPEYHWGYNRMMTVEGLFGAGDAIGGTPTSSRPARSRKAASPPRPPSSTSTTERPKASSYPMSRSSAAGRRSTSRWSITGSTATRSWRAPSTRTTSIPSRAWTACRSSWTSIAAAIPSAT